jgi:glycosyltransferase involved in cell wall biosynthesis
MCADPKVSVIVPVFNGAKYIEASIRSALAQNYANLEIVVVNDGSTDSTSQEIESFLNLPNFLYVEQANLGVAAARNKGLLHATGEIIAFLDHDDLWLPHKIKLQVEYLISHPEVALVHSNYSAIDATGNPAVLQLSPQWPTNVEGRCFKDLFTRNRLALLTVLVRKKCLDRAGLFNEQMSAAEDYELWLRLAWYYPFGYMPERLALYRIHNSNASQNLLNMELMELGAINSVLAQFPEIPRTIGNRLVRKRLAELNYVVGSLYMWQEEDFKTARRFFLQSFKARPFHKTSLRRYFWCSLSAPQRRAITWYAHKMRLSP